MRWYGQLIPLLVVWAAFSQSDAASVDFTEEKEFCDLSKVLKIVQNCSPNTQNQTDLLTGDQKSFSKLCNVFDEFISCHAIEIASLQDCEPSPSMQEVLDNAIAGLQEQRKKCKEQLMAIYGADVEEEVTAEKNKTEINTDEPATTSSGFEVSEINETTLVMETSTDNETHSAEAEKKPFVYLPEYNIDCNREMSKIVAECVPQHDVQFPKFDDPEATVLEAMRCLNSKSEILERCPILDNTWRELLMAIQEFGTEQRVNVRGVVPDLYSRLSEFLESFYVCKSTYAKHQSNYCKNGEDNFWSILINCATAGQTMHHKHREVMQRCKQNINGNILCNNGNPNADNELNFSKFFKCSLDGFGS